MLRNERIETEDVENVVTDSFSDFDDHRVEGLTNLSIIQESKVASDERNLARLQGKYGDSHTLVLETQAKIESNKIFVEEINREIQRTETPVPNGNADAWTIHGYVLGETNNAVPKAPVMIFDEQGESLPRREQATTDNRGYFRLPVKGLKDLPKTVRVGVSSEFIGDEIFTPELGEVDYIEIFVSKEIDEIPPCDPNQPPTGEPIPTGQNFKDWLVTGKITDSTGKGIAKLKVLVFDRDLVFDDALGETETNGEGVYRLTFTTEQFSDFIEKYPELYLIIEDAAGNRLFDGKRETKNRAGRIELIDVQLGDKR